MKCLLPTPGAEGGPGWHRGPRKGLSAKSWLWPVGGTGQG